MRRRLCELRQQQLDTLGHYLRLDVRLTVKEKVTVLNKSTMSFVSFDVQNSDLSWNLLSTFEL